MAVLILGGSVGSGTSQKGIPHNDLWDVEKVRHRLVELGYWWIENVQASTIQALLEVEWVDFTLELPGNSENRW